jgi:antitoxin component YwqK of YwqJK toxin-antitoxin module
MQIRDKKIVKLNLITADGQSETITDPEQLKGYQSIDFLEPQPYQKVLRIFNRFHNGNIPSVITSYHPNGQIYQYLEAIDGRAKGLYKEWYETGVKRIEAVLDGGIADLYPAAEKQWVFQGKNYVWDEQGHLVALILYQNGLLDGAATYYYTDGRIKKVVPYCKGAREGTSVSYFEDGQVQKEADYKEGKRQGITKVWRRGHLLQYQEIYQSGKLVTGFYYDKNQNLTDEVIEGEGWKIREVWDGALHKYQIKKGELDGEVRLYNLQNQLEQIYHMHNDKRHGEQLIYYTDNLLGKLALQQSIDWYEDCIHGLVKTWYLNGQLASQRHMCRNKKQGLCSAWYPNGDLMLMEDYDGDLLIKGEYFSKGKKFPDSVVNNGSGIASIFDSEGRLLNRIKYKEGRIVSP